MTESYTSAVLRQTIKQIRVGSRDLGNAGLASYYGVRRRLPSAEIASRAAASASFRQAAGLRPLSAAEAAQQIGDSGSQALFQTLMAGVGIERENEADLVSLPAGEAVPELGDRTTFVQTKAAQGKTLTIKDVRDGLRAVEALSSRLPTGNTTLHVLEDAQPALADDDSTVQGRLDRMWDYVRDLLP